MWNVFTAFLISPTESTKSVSNWLTLFRVGSCFYSVCNCFYVLVVLVAIIMVSPVSLFNYQFNLKLINFTHIELNVLTILLKHSHQISASCCSWIKTHSCVWVQLNPKMNLPSLWLIHSIWQTETMKLNILGYFWQNKQFETEQKFTSDIIHWFSLTDSGNVWSVAPPAVVTRY